MSEIFAAQRKLYSCFQKTELVARIVASAFEHIGIHGLLLEKKTDTVGELDLTPPPFAGLFEESENLRSQNVPADDCQIGRSFTDGRFLDNVLYAINTATEA